jgi:hypothetical protein
MECESDLHLSWDESQCTETECYVDYCDTCEEDNECSSCLGPYFVDDEFMCSECLEGCEECSNGELCDACYGDLHMHWDNTSCSSI